MQSPVLVIRTAALALVVCAGIGACGGSDSPTSLPPTPKAAEIGPSVLLPESLLTAGCYGWPEEEFTATNHAVMGVRAAGQPAIDFTLLDLSGTPHRLSELLQSRPVFMVFGAFT